MVCESQSASAARALLTLCIMSAISLATNHGLGCTRQSCTIALHSFVHGDEASDKAVLAVATPSAGE